MSFELESLEETAFNAVYGDLLESLSEFLHLDNEENVDVEISGVVEGSDALKEEAVHEEPEENPSKKAKLENLVEVSSKPKQTREELINSKREALDEYLIGNYSHYRQQLMGKFSSEYIYHRGKDLWLLFLDCVLDKSFTELDISQFIVVSDPVNVFKIVGNRCSLLNSLELYDANDEELGEIPPLQMTREIESGICQMLSNLKNLTTINLSCVCQPNTLCLAFFNSLGSSCPQLTHLELEHFPFGTRQLFALMFGMKEGLVPHFFKSQPRGTVNQLHSLQFSSESLTSICSSLKTIKSERPSYTEVEDYYYYRPEEEGLCILGDSSTLAFMLRHFPKLVEFNQTCHHRSRYDDDNEDHSCCGSDCGHGGMKYIEHSAAELTKATELLYISQDLQADETVTNVSSSVSLGRIEWSTNSPHISGRNFPWIEANLNFFNSTFQLENNNNAILGVASLWSNLETVRFVGVYSHLSHLPAINDDFVQKLKALLASGCWSKLRHVTFERINLPAFRQAILTTIGSQLHSLEFKNCWDIDLKMEVLPCCKLESLIIDKYCKLLRPDNPFIDCGLPSSFLPCLKKLQLDVCLGQFSCLFESERPLLTDVFLCCLHFGIARITGSVGWKDLPNMWPNLEVLCVTSNDLSLPYLLNVKFKCLKRIIIIKFRPNNSASSAEQDALPTTDIIKYFKLKNPGIQVLFGYVTFKQSCSFY